MDPSFVGRPTSRPHPWIDAIVVPVDVVQVKQITIKSPNPGLAVNTSTAGLIMSCFEADWPNVNSGPTAPFNVFYSTHFAPCAYYISDAAGDWSVSYVLNSAQTIAGEIAAFKILVDPLFTPTDRIVHVSTQNRTINVPSSPRRIVASSQNRTISVTGASRLISVPSLPRRTISVQ